MTISGHCSIGYYKEYASLSFEGELVRAASLEISLEEEDEKKQSKGSR
jgi:hypothetical protein